MEKLRAHLNSLSSQEQAAFCARCDNVSIGYLRKAISTGEQLRPALAVDIERESAGSVRRWDVRPLDWHRIWPELVDAEGAPPIPAAPAVAAG